MNVFTVFLLSHIFRGNVFEQIFLLIYVPVGSSPFVTIPVRIQEHGFRVPASIFRG